MREGTERQKRVAELIRQEAARFINTHLPPKPLVTVTRADVSKDLKKSTVYFTVLPNEEEERTHTLIKKKAHLFRENMKERLSTKSIPFFSFSIDEGEKMRQRMDEIL
ncbi:MAG: ribosome-binding factor A [Candidatus Paceibacterota bacterium]